MMPRITFIRSIAYTAMTCLFVLPANSEVLADATTAPARNVLTEDDIRLLSRHTPLPPAPDDPTNRVADDPRAQRLGQFLFFDARLSANGQISCATCHDPATGFSDGAELPQGLGIGTRHSLSLWNAAYHRWLFWDGRSDSLWAQALHPLERDIEMGHDRTAIAHLVFGDDALRAAYEHIFGELPDLSDRSRFPPRARPVPDQPDHPHHQAWLGMREADREAITRIFVNIGKTIAAYERLLISRDAPFDCYMQRVATGDRSPSPEFPIEAIRGAALFVGAANCRVCHMGPNFTDSEFHDSLVPPLDGGRPRDPGRHTGTQEVRADPFNALGPYSDERDGLHAERVEFLIDNPANWGRFRTPTLRNVALSPPYMHQGQFKSLHDVVRFYSTLDGAVRLGHHQETILVPLHLTEQEIDDLVSFLETLTDDSLDAELLSPPASPLPDEP